MIRPEGVETLTTFGEFEPLLAELHDDEVRSGPGAARDLFFGRLIKMIYGPNYDQKFMLRAALEGFAAAHDRFNAAWGAGVGAEEIFIPLSEALWWTVTVDDGFESLAASDQGYRPNLGDYRNARDNDPEGQVLRALRYTRDRCGHQRALVTGVRLPTIPMPIPAFLGPVFCWRPSADLPPPDPRFNSPALQSEYDRLLSGRPAAAALGSARRWFDQERVRAGF